MKGDEGPSVEQMVPHTRQKDPYVRQRAGLTGKWDEVSATGKGAEQYHSGKLSKLISAGSIFHRQTSIQGS